MTYQIFKPHKITGPMLSDWFHEPFNSHFFQRTSLPPVNIQETDKGWNIDLAVPGIPKEKIKIKLEHQVLTVSAENTEKEEIHQPKYHRKEFGFVHFERSFSLPTGVDADGIEAKQEEGVLHIFLPHKTAVKTEKKIEIQ
jgi:HSP20 family protein